jgi:1-acyl-sn-glycerol-3-phosphate acyltransferase
MTLRALFFLPTFTVVTMTMSAVSLFFTIFDRTGSVFRHFSLAWSSVGLWLAGVKLEVIGDDNYDRSKTYIIVSNHASMFDILSVLVAIKLNLRIVAKEELLRIPIWGFAVKRGDFLFIRRGGNREAMKTLLEAREKISQGKSIYMFADGTRSVDGSIQPFKRGAFTLASKTGADVLPVTILGSYRIMPKGTMKVYAGKITIVVDKPISVSGKDDETLLKESYETVLKNYHQYNQAA